MRVLIVEDEPLMADAIRDGLRLEAIAADIAGDGDTALQLLSFNAYDIAVIDRDIPGPSGDEIAERIVASGSGMPILMLTAADRLDDKASGFGLGADDYLTKPFELQELVLRLRALDRRRVHNRPPVREIAGLRLDPFRREVYRDGRYVALTRKQFAVLEVLVAAEGGIVSAEELLARAWDENADPFTNAVRITISGLRKRLGEPWIIATVAGARAAGMSSASSPTPSTPCSPGSKHTSLNSRDSQPTPPTNCAPRWRSRRHFSTWPATIPTATTASSSNASTPSTPERSTSLKHCSCSAAPTSGPSPENTSTCPSSRKKPRKRSSPSQKNAASPSRPSATRRPPPAHPRSCCR